MNCGGVPLRCGAGVGKNTQTARKPLAKKLNWCGRGEKGTVIERVQACTNLERPNKAAVHCGGARAD